MKISECLISLHIQSGSRLFGFVGAGATFGQLIGSLFAASMAWLGPCMNVIIKLGLFVIFTHRFAKTFYSD
jgi:CHASE2 domain-containing sensor protein